MKKIIYSIILSFFISSVAYTENSAYPEEGKTYKCTDSKHANNVVEFTFSKVKKGQSGELGRTPEHDWHVGCCETFLLRSCHERFQFNQKGFAGDVGYIRLS